jgi:outer membrane protein assembly factor BamB
MKKTVKRRTRRQNRHSILQLAVFLTLVIVLGVLIHKQSTLDLPATSISRPGLSDEVPRKTPTPSNGEEEEQPQASDTPALPEFAPYAVDATKPGNLISSTAVSVNGVEQTGYTLKNPIDFGTGDQYTDVQGIVTFRGNNFRSSAAYGTADLQYQKLAGRWTVNTGALQAPDQAVWTGSGWVGQPLMMTWPKETRQHMNMYDWAKQAETLTEVIYATMDGNVYFMDLLTGEKTRDDLHLGFTFKGAGALDPRGYPILYLGSGYDSSQGTSRVFIINLYDCSTMYQFGNSDPFSLRGNLSYFDGSPLVDAETDQLIYPGENGILYIMKLNTQIDESTGTLSINPDSPVKWRYYGNRSGSWYLGMEDSAVIWRGHIIMSTNDGYLFCLDLNTLETVWVQDVLDDTNCTPVLELEDGHPYIYTSTSFHLGWRSSTTATIPVWKIDAVTGEIIWHTDYTCYSVEGTSGGVQGTLALGENGLSDLIFVPVARTPNASSGQLVALRKDTGEEVWCFDTEMYAWSSPVAFYDSTGKGYLVYCTAGGYMYLLDGLTGEVLDSMNLESNVEASPAVYNDMVVVGTRGQKIYGICLT